VLSGGERGLLGLAFHPQYSSNGRFFVFYTRTGDGAIIVAEYRVSANPDIASSSETVLLTIPHPNNANHNGGMLAFGPDTFLYIGVGDGGSANDPPNNAQNTNALLGKILRINVDQPDPVARTPYSSPSDNPFVNIPGRDEIFALGLRNPWRFSFDRLTGQPWVGDVGQSRDEVNTPLLNGGNYGWRVFEGFLCTNLDPSLCIRSNYVFPLFDYSHMNGRCSLTGGYVYRGSLEALESGTYVFGDNCSGEIFTWDGAQSVLLDTAMRIASFGEDEQGELYVVDLGGSISRIAAECTGTLSPANQAFGVAGGPGGVSVTVAEGCEWTATSNVSWIRLTSGSRGNGNGLVQYTVDVNTSSMSRITTMTIAGQTFDINQSGPGTTCRYALSPTSPSFPQGGGTGSVRVTAPAGCNWVAVTRETWITVTGGQAGNGSGTVTYAVAPYVGQPRSRSGTMTIGGVAMSVRQSR
jgi:hypothetical protein